MILVGIVDGEAAPRVIVQKVIGEAAPGVLHRDHIPAPGIEHSRWFSPTQVHQFEEQGMALHRQVQVGEQVRCAATPVEPWGMCGGTALTVL